MSEIDSCVRICENYYRFRKLIAVFSTICEVNFFSTNFAFRHPPRNLSLGSRKYFHDSFFPRSISDSPAKSVWKSLKNCRRFRNFKTSVAREIQSFFSYRRKIITYACDDNGFFRLECTCTGRFWVVFKGNEPLKFVWYSSIPEKALPWVEPRILSHRNQNRSRRLGPRDAQE